MTTLSKLLKGLVDLDGFEPSTSSMPWKRAPNCATGPRWIPGSKLDQPQADLDGFIHPFHVLPGEPADLLLEPQSVHRPNLVGDNGRALRQTAVCRFNHDFPGERRLREMGTDGRHDGDWAVLVGDVIPDDDGGPSFLDLVADCGVERNQVDLAATGKGYFFLFRPWATCHAPSSKGNHSAAICRSRSALARASCFSRSRRFCRPWVST